MDSMDLFYFKMGLSVGGSVVVMMFSILGTVAYHGVKIGLLFRKEKGNKVQKKKPSSKK